MATSKKCFYITSTKLLPQIEREPKVYLAWIEFGKNDLGIDLCEREGETKLGRGKSGAAMLLRC